MSVKPYQTPDGRWCYRWVRLMSVSGLQQPVQVMGPRRTFDPLDPASSSAAIARATEDGREIRAIPQLDPVAMGDQ